MSLAAVGKNGRVYKRRFDHDEAAARHAAGETIADLAREYAVTEGAIRIVVTPGGKAAARAYAKKWRTGTCESCNGPAMRLVQGKKGHNPDGRVLCNRCRGRAKRERLLFDASGSLIAVRCSALDCATGERWQTPENFPRGQRLRDVRAGGIHQSCRACLTRARQIYRERHKVPCVDCGKPALPPSEKTTTGTEFPRCRPCYLAEARIQGTSAPRPQKDAA